MRGGACGGMGGGMGGGYGGRAEGGTGAVRTTPEGASAASSVIASESPSEGSDAKKRGCHPRAISAEGIWRARCSVASTSHGSSCWAHGRT